MDKVLDLVDHEYKLKNINLIGPKYLLNFRIYVDPDSGIKLKIRPSSYKNKKNSYYLNQSYSKWSE